MKYFRLMVLLLLVPVSCVREEMPEHSVDLRFEINATRSSVLTGESEVCGFTVFAYSSGLLESSATWTPGSSAAGMQLVAGRPYNLYALANTETPVLPLHESELAAYACRMDSQLGIPMVWSSVGRVFSSPETVYLDFTRLAAKLDLSLDKTALNGARIKSVALRQAMKECIPFGSSCRARLSSDVASGDAASEEDLEVLNSGGSISLYALENCQGVLLPGNTSSWRKVPPAGCGDLCTYIEIVCEFLEGSPISGEAIYRIFPGKDALGDFSLERNSSISIRLILTDIGLDTAMDLVENNTDYRPDLAAFALSGGMHDVDDMYVGEMLTFQLIPSDELLAFWSDGRFANSAIVFGYEDDGEIRRLEDCLEISFPYQKDGAYYFDVIVCNIIPTHSACHFYLYDDQDRKLVAKLNSRTVPNRETTIRPAVLGIAELDGQGRCVQPPSDQISSFDLTVNGPSGKVGIYLMDEGGRVFPSVRTAHFDPELYSDLSARYSPDNALTTYCSESQRTAVLGCCRVITERGQGDYPYPFRSIECSIVNDGSRPLANQGLSAVLSRAFALTIDFSCSLAYLHQYVVVEALPWKAWLLGEHTSCGFALNPQAGNITQIALYNPSHIDLDLFLGLFLHSDLSARPNYRYFVDDSIVFRDAWMSRLDVTLAAADAASIRGDGLFCYGARLDGLDVDVYRIQYGNSYYCDLASVYGAYRFAYFQDSLYEHGMDGEGCGSFAEASLQSRSGHTVPGSTFTDLAGSGGGADSAMYRYRGLNLWENGSLVQQAGIDPLGPHTVGDLKRVVSEQGVEFAFSWDSSGDLYCSIGDEAGKVRSYQISVRPVYYVYLRYTPDGGNTYYYLNNEHSFVNYPELYRISSQTDSRLTSKASYAAPSGSQHRMAFLFPMEKEMALINRTYWLASSSRSSYYDTGTGLISLNHRWSTMALPQRIDMELSITCDSPDWVPINLTLASITLNLGGYDFYEKTEDGYFAVYGESSSSGRPSAGLNPDGSPRTNGAEGMQAGKKAILPEITSSAAASNVIPMSDCVVELAYSDVGISRVSYR